MLLFSVLLASAGHAQSIHYKDTPPRIWAERAVQNQLQIQAGDGQYAQYRLQKIDETSNTTKEVIETKDGLLSRLVALDDKPLPPELERAQRARLQQLQAHPEGYAKHRKREQEDTEHALKVIRLIPDAFLWSYASEQTLKGYPGQVVVLDFKPNPQFAPPMREAAVFRSLEGRAWVDPHSHCMLRLEAHLFQDVDFGWGLLARIYKGGTTVVEQQDVGQNHWEPTYFELHLSGKALLLKSLKFNIQLRTSNFKLLSDPPTLEQGIQLLQQLDPQVRSSNHQP
ncbi:MAG: hypothetical protein ACYC46_12405 [Acidobacteriaceae bacterium]